MHDEQELRVTYAGKLPPEDIPLSSDQEDVFRRFLITGIYKELYHLKAVTGTQLNDLFHRL